MDPEKEGKISRVAQAADELIPMVEQLGNGEVVLSREVVEAMDGLVKDLLPFDERVANRCEMLPIITHCGCVSYTENGQGVKLKMVRHGQDPIEVDLCETEEGVEATVILGSDRVVRPVINLVRSNQRVSGTDEEGWKLVEVGRIETRSEERLEDGEWYWGDGEVMKKRLWPLIQKLAETRGAEAVEVVEELAGLLDGLKDDGIALWGEFDLTLEEGVGARLLRLTEAAKEIEIRMGGGVLRVSFGFEEKYIPVAWIPGERKGLYKKVGGITKTTDLRFLNVGEQGFKEVRSEDGRVEWQEIRAKISD